MRIVADGVCGEDKARMGWGGRKGDCEGEAGSDGVWEGGRDEDGCVGGGGRGAGGEGGV